MQTDAETDVTLLQTEEPQGNPQVCYAGQAAGPYLLQRNLNKESLGSALWELFALFWGELRRNHVWPQKKPQTLSECKGATQTL